MGIDIRGKAFSIGESSPRALILFWMRALRYGVSGTAFLRTPVLYTAASYASCCTRDKVPRQRDFRKVRNLLDLRAGLKKV